MNHLVLQTGIYTWLFQLDDEPNHYIKNCCFNKTSIKNWLFRVPYLYIFIYNYVFNDLGGAFILFLFGIRRIQKGSSTHLQPNSLKALKLDL